MPSGNLSGLGVQNPRLWEISLGPREVYFPIHPSSRQCTDPSLLKFVYFWTIGIGKGKLPHPLFFCFCRILCGGLLFGEQVTRECAKGLVKAIPSDFFATSCVLVFFATSCILVFFATSCILVFFAVYCILVFFATSCIFVFLPHLVFLFFCRILYSCIFCHILYGGVNG